MDMELVESYCLRVQYKGGGIFHGRLNRGEKPIANKYCEGKLAWGKQLTVGLVGKCCGAWCQ